MASEPAGTVNTETTRRNTLDNGSPSEEIWAMLCNLRIEGMVAADSQRLGHVAGALRGVQVKSKV